MHELNRTGYDHATTGKSPDPTLVCELDYISGYREGLATKLKWAEDDLNCFEAEYVG
jgi:hypothetical protein